MTIVSVCFDLGVNKRYKNLCDVFEYSIKKNCPDAKLIIEEIEAPQKQGRFAKYGFIANTIKLKKWYELIMSIDDDIVLMDCDMVVLSDISEAFNYDFDIGYTKRSHGSPERMPVNGGVMFIRNNDRAKNFIRLLRDINDDMFYLNKQLHDKWRKTYAGMNQAAFGYLINEINHGAKLKSFPCAVWNSCSDDWPNIDNETKIIHIKSQLRDAVFSEKECRSKLKKALDIWELYAAEAGVVVVKEEQLKKQIILNKPTKNLPIKTIRRKRRRRL